MKPLTLTPSVQFRGYPRLTAPDSGKTRLNAPNRAKIFSGGSRASIRACATPTATPVHPSALARTNTAATKMAGPPHGFSALFCAVWCYLVLFGPNFYLALGSVLASGCPYMDIIRYLNTHGFPAFNKVNLNTWKKTGFQNWRTGSETGRAVVTSPACAPSTG